MRILFLGPPGAGKGTQSKLLAERYGLFHLAPGDIFRQEVKNGTELGKLVEGIMARGELVPDDVTVKIVEKRLDSEEAKKGLVLDGFPRNMNQALHLEEALKQRGQSLDLVIELSCDEEELIQRSMTRRVCSRCGRPYNLKLQPPRVPGKCDVCGGDLIIRKDDTESTIRERFRVYNEVTSPLRDFYREKGILVTVDGEGEVDQVFSRILGVLKEKGLVKEESDIL